MAVNAPEAGTIKEFLVNEEDTVTVGQDIVRLELGGAPSSSKEQKQENAESQPESAAEPKAEPKSEEPKQAPPPSKPEPAKETPAAPQSASPPKPAAAPKSAAPAEEAGSRSSIGSREERRVCIRSSLLVLFPPKAPIPERFSPPNPVLTLSKVKMNRMRLRIAERLKQSQNTAASLTTFNEVDMSSLMELRKLYKDDVLKKQGVKLGFMGAFSRACVLAMRDLPVVNASIEGPNGGDTIVYRDYVDISVAVATEKGLVTPVVRNAESMEIVEIEQAISELGKKVSTYVTNWLPSSILTF